ncbi:MAG: hypothetical protein ACREGR_03265 [Minisyncoccia bacterium]
MNSDTNTLFLFILSDMKTASASSAKWQQNSANGAGSYVSGVQNTTKDQAALAAAAAGNWFAGVQAANAAGTFAKNVQAAGKSAWQQGVAQKGAQNYGTGVSAASSATKYQTNSGKYDSARSAAASVARGPKGSPGNIQRVSAVVTAERAVKAGK